VETIRAGSSARWAGLNWVRVITWVLGGPVLSFWAAKTAGVIWLNESLFGKVRARVQRIVTVMPDWCYPAILLVSLSAGVLVMALLASPSARRHFVPPPLQSVWLPPARW